MSRYDAMFSRLTAEGAGAFIPFAMLGDPAPAASYTVLASLIAGGADALELGLPFSDPVADGPVIQAAAVRALGAGATLESSWRTIREVRLNHPDLPIGILVYANLVSHRSLEQFYGEAGAAGVDSVLVADLPVSEAAPYCEAARNAGIAPVFIAPPNADAQRLAAIAAKGKGYTYVVTRRGVTGIDRELQHEGSALLSKLRELRAAPPVLGFGIATPHQVREAVSSGAAGAISGSAVVAIVERHADNLSRLSQELTNFVRQMKQATVPGPTI